MYKALYSYNGEESDTMPIQSGDKLTLVEVVDEHWRTVHNSNGDIGLVPVSYLEIEKVSKANILASTDSAIKQLQRQNKSGSSDRIRHNLQQLLDHKHRQQQPATTDSNQSVPQTTRQLSPVELPRQPSRAAPKCPAEAKVKRHAPSPPHASESQGSCLSSSSSETLKALRSCDIIRLADVKIPPSIGIDLVFAVRQDTGMSYSKSQKAAISVVDALAKMLPALQEPLHDVLSSLCQDEVIESVSSEQHDEDSSALRAVLDQLVEHKDDSQQRVWATHEDFAVLKDLLDSVLSIMSESSPAVAIHVLRHNDYHYVDSLILYYQLETRAKLRVPLLQIFGCFCDLGKDFVCYLLYSVLTTELAETAMNDQSDASVLLHSIVLLTMIFSTGNDVNHNQYDQLNEAFVEAILRMIESPPAWDDSEQIPEACVALLLSFNQHFRDPSSNFVMRLLGNSTTWKVFSERILLLFNREEDPVVMLKHHSVAQPSVVKFLADLFATSSTSQLFFTNDLMVLIEVVVRQTTDRAPGDELRTEYLSLLYSIVMNTNYSEHQHMRQQINACLDSILAHEEEAAEADLFIVRQIRADFPEMFGSRQDTVV